MRRDQHARQCRCLQSRTARKREEFDRDLQGKRKGWIEISRREIRSGVASAPWKNGVRSKRRAVEDLFYLCLILPILRDFVSVKILYAWGLSIQKNIKILPKISGERAIGSRLVLDYHLFDADGSRDHRAGLPAKLDR